jgi:hypothetical protein
MAEQQDYDSPWKNILDLQFEEFMAFFFPSAHAQIDWQAGHEFLDKELQKIALDAALGRRVVDKLVKVQLTNGQEQWVSVSPAACSSEATLASKSPGCIGSSIG